MLPQKLRLNKTKDIENVSKKGKSIGSKFFVLKYLPNSSKNSRIGFVISTKISKKAVERNKIKRQMREIIRTHINEIPHGYDILFFTKVSIKDVNFSTLEETILKKLSKI